MATRKGKTRGDRWAQSQRRTRASEPAVESLLAWGGDVKLYARSSTDEQARSCSQQIAEIEREIRKVCVDAEEIVLPRKHAPEHGVYADEGISGWKYSPEEREGCRTLYDDCAADPRPRDRRGYVYVWSLSRLGRFADGPEEAIYWIYALRKTGWWLRSLTQPDLDSDDRDRLMRVIRAALEAEKDTASSEEKSAGVSRGKSDQVRLGVWQGGIAPFGYERWAVRLHGADEIEWIERLPRGKRNGNADSHTLLRPGPMWDRAEEIFRTYASGEDGVAVSMEDIARRFNEEGVEPYLKRSRKRRNNPTAGVWYHTTIGKILSNEAYVGIQRDNEDVPHRALWEPLVTREEWDHVQRRRIQAGNDGKGVNSLYLLSGLLHCAECGDRLHGDCTDGVRYYKSKRRAPGSPRCQGCRFRVRSDVIEPAVLQVIPDMANHPVVLRQVAIEQQALKGGANSARTRIKAVEDLLNDRRDQIRRLVEVLAYGGEAAKQVGDKLSELNSEIERLDRERARLRTGATGRSPAAEQSSQADFFSAAFREAAPAERKALIAHLVARVELDADRDTVRVGFRRPPLSTAMG